jgi:hypothetical protein
MMFVLVEYVAGMICENLQFSEKTECIQPC